MVRGRDLTGLLVRGDGGREQQHPRKPQDGTDLRGRIEMAFVHGIESPAENDFDSRAHGRDIASSLSRTSRTSPSRPWPVTAEIVRQGVPFASA